MKRLILPIAALVLLFGALRPVAANAAKTYIANFVVNSTSFQPGQKITVSGEMFVQDGATRTPVAGQVSGWLDAPGVEKSDGTRLFDATDTKSDGTFSVPSAPLAAGLASGDYRVFVFFNSQAAIDMGISGLTSAYSAVKIVSAAAAAAGGGTGGSGTPAAKTTAAGLGISIPNPLGSCNDATCLISRIIKSILGIVAIIATFMFIWGGILMMTSGGNERQVKQARDTLVWAAIGIVIILISWTLIKFVLQSFLNKPSTPNLTSPAQIKS